MGEELQDRVVLSKPSRNPTRPAEEEMQRSSYLLHTSRRMIMQSLSSSATELSLDAILSLTPKPTSSAIEAPTLCHLDLRLFRIFRK
jgi:hypothetical protein